MSALFAGTNSQIVLPSLPRDIVGRIRMTVREAVGRTDAERDAWQAAVDAVERPTPAQWTHWLADPDEARVLALLERHGHKIQAPQAGRIALAERLVAGCVEEPGAWTPLLDWASACGWLTGARPLMDRVGATAGTSDPDTVAALGCCRAPALWEAVVPHLRAIPDSLLDAARAMPDAMAALSTRAELLEHAWAPLIDWAVLIAVAPASRQGDRRAALRVLTAAIAAGHSLTDAHRDALVHGAIIGGGSTSGQIADVLFTERAMTPAQWEDLADAFGTRPALVRRMARLGRADMPLTVLRRALRDLAQDDLRHALARRTDVIHDPECRALLEAHASPNILRRLLRTGSAAEAPTRFLRLLAVSPPNALSAIEQGDLPTGASIPEGALVVLLQSPQQRIRLRTVEVLAVVATSAEVPPRAVAVAGRSTPLEWIDVPASCPHEGAPSRPVSLPR
jgi:hypothetical protein